LGGLPQDFGSSFEIGSGQKTRRRKQKDESYCESHGHQKHR
jgi:hypothetical protein